MTASPFGEHAARVDNIRSACAALVAAIDGDDTALDVILGNAPDLRELTIAITSYAALVSVAFHLGDRAAARALLTTTLATIASAEAGDGQ